MATTEIAALEPRNRVQLPAEWVQSLGLCGSVSLEQTSDGILVRAAATRTWDEFFATGLEVGSAERADDDDEFEVTRDDLLF
ncbi:MAG TPA: hypothetical protein VNH11_33320 [Pirellulales bacterium]|nr:hypothetical protein [Pirellulales bacterium]